MKHIVSLLLMLVLFSSMKCPVNEDGTSPPVSTSEEILVPEEFIDLTENFSTLPTSEKVTEQIDNYVTPPNLECLEIEKNSSTFLISSCQSVKGEQWEQVTVDGIIYTVPKDVDVAGFLKVCKDHAISRLKRKFSLQLLMSSKNTLIAKKLLR